jgi:hypothetical protein
MDVAGNPPDHLLISNDHKSCLNPVKKIIMKTFKSVACLAGIMVMLLTDSKVLRNQPK